MPGLSFVYELRRDLESRTQSLIAAQEATLHDIRDVTRIVSRSDSHFLAFSGYPEYPITCHRFARYDVHLEGRLYGVDAATLEETLARLPALMTTDRPRQDLTEWLLDVDGDFVVYVFDRETGVICIVNDVLGRLPLYCWRTAESLVLSRDLRFIVKLMPNLRFDRMAIAQHLLLGFPVGGRTLVDEVERLDGATLIRVGARRQEWQVTKLHQFNFEPKPRAVHGTHDNAVELVGLLRHACAARSQSGSPKVISMSGGFDSRLIAGGFRAAGTAFSCATFVDHIGNAAADVVPAELVARLFGCPWKLVRLGPPCSSDVLKLLRRKSGMNPLAMSFLLPFLASVRDEWGPALWFSTGELGTFTLHEPAPNVVLARSRDVVDYLIAQSQKLPLDLVACLTMLEESEILAELERLVAGYPEQALGEKLVHFILIERTLRWQSEAEDRNRGYFWTITPFSSPRFFTAAMSCPNDQKRYYGLYREILLELSPAAAAIVHAGMGSAITSEEFRRDAKVAALLAHHPRRTVSLRDRCTPLPSYRSDSTVVRWLDQQLASCPLLFDSLARPVLADVVRRCSEYSWDRVDLLFTVTAAIEDLGTGQSLLSSISGAS